MRALLPPYSGEVNSSRLTHTAGNDTAPPSAAPGAPPSSAEAATPEAMTLTTSAGTGDMGVGCEEWSSRTAGSRAARRGNLPVRAIAQCATPSRTQSVESKKPSTGAASCASPPSEPPAAPVRPSRRRRRARRTPTTRRASRAAARRLIVAAAATSGAASIVATVRSGLAPSALNDAGRGVDRVAGTGSRWPRTVERHARAPATPSAAAAAETSSMEKEGSHAAAPPREPGAASPAVVSPSPSPLLPSAPPSAAVRPRGAGSRSPPSPSPAAAAEPRRISPGSGTRGSVIRRMVPAAPDAPACPARRAVAAAALQSTMAALEAPRTRTHRPVSSSHTNSDALNGRSECMLSTKPFEKPLNAGGRDYCAAPVSTSSVSLHCN